VPIPQSDGSFLWALPLGQGHVPVIALSDFAYFTRYIFDNPSEVSGVNLEIASEMVTLPDLVQTFEKVTGKKGVYRDISLDQYFSNLPPSFPADGPVARDVPDGVSRPNLNPFHSPKLGPLLRYLLRLFSITCELFY
jgi:uncharacterized protein YbjT (DUF2867 family)